jgi:alpha-tubulin suppressor-like RCC1 family protein
MAAIKTDGTLWTWGNNNNGFLGDNTTTGRSSPVQTAAAGTNWKQVSVGSNSHMAAIKTDSTLWLWGANAYGQLATNTNAHKSSPVQTIAGGTNWKMVACGSTHTSCMKTDGTLWLWGSNQDGKLGNNNTTSTSSPIQTVAGGTNWKLLSSGFYHMMCIRDDSSDEI